MPEWPALGVKSSTSVAPLGAPGSAPPPPQPASAAASRAAASSAATRLIGPGTLVAPANRDRLPPASSPQHEEGARVQERGLSAYLAELIGTFLLVFFITSVVTLYVATGTQAQFG